MLIVTYLSVFRQKQCIFGDSVIPVLDCSVVVEMFNCWLFMKIDYRQCDSKTLVFILFLFVRDSRVLTHRMLMTAGSWSWYSVKENPGLDYFSGFL